jgi:hypothetical protein
MAEQQQAVMQHSKQHTLARGARQLVVQLALETTLWFLGSYLSWLTPITNMGASAEGAEMITFLAPALMCAWHCRHGQSKTQEQQCKAGKRGFSTLS